MDYEASGGREILLSFEDDKETLFGLLRMRIQDRPIARLGQEIDGNIVLIRELHVYGPELPLGQRKLLAAQHRGLGRALLLEAEKIARQEFRVQAIVILSGVGAREYYRSEFDYILKGDYMIKTLGAKGN